MLEKFLPTPLSQLTAIVLMPAISGLWFFLDSFLELMPFSLTANLLLTKLLLVMVVTIIGLLIIIVSIVKSHNKISSQKPQIAYGVTIELPKRKAFMGLER